jgi:acetylornithine deacetylase/succinyl-diaminopimelate desuccinylase-like protein
LQHSTSNLPEGEVVRYFRSNIERFKSEWFEFLSINSVSTGKVNEDNCLNAAYWVKKHLEKLGFTTKLISTSGLPAVYGERKGKIDKSLLYYGHYDVQPAEDTELWSSPPFEPVERDGRIYARGAADNKGQTFYFLKALEYLIFTNNLNLEVRVLIEGEEECGSTGLSRLLDDNPTVIKPADILLVCDSGCLDLQQPMIVVSFRGVTSLECVVKGANRDLHSGIHGGIVRNPALELARVLAKIHDDNGRIAIPNFYDGISELSSKESEELNKFPLDDNLYQLMTGVFPAGGECGYSLAERGGIRPTIEINSLISGYLGKGVLPSIPAEAKVKLTSRLVKGQDPSTVSKQIEDFLRNNLPSELTFEVIFREEGGKSFEVDINDSYISIATEVLSNICTHRPLLRWEGGSIPILAKLNSLTKSSPILVGFVLDKDNVHSANESFSWEQVELGFKFVFGFIDRLQNTSF